MQKVIKKTLPYLITALTGSAVSVLIMFACYKIHAVPPAPENSKEIFGVLSNSFLVSGVILSGLGLIIFAGNGGTFDMLSYAVIRLFDLFKRNVKGRYKDFCAYRGAKKGGKLKTSFMLFVGLAFIALSVIFLICYYNV